MLKIISIIIIHISVLFIFVNQQSTSIIVSGLVTNDKIEFLPNAIITLRNKETYEEYQFVTNNDGEFIVENIREGNYSINVSSDGYKDQNLSMNLTYGTNLNLIIKLKPIEKLNNGKNNNVETDKTSNLKSSIKMIGKVMDRNGKELFDGVVTIKELTSNFEKDAEINGNGEFKMDNIPEGQYKIYVNCVGHNTCTIKANLVNGSTIQLTVKMK